MNSLTDQQLLREYTGRRSEAAFAELVRRRVEFIILPFMVLSFDYPSSGRLNFLFGLQLGRVFTGD